MNKGFAIIEMIIYTALFSIMMGGLVVTVYQLSESAKNTESEYIESEEINFIYKKINWALTSIEQINSPLGAASNSLNVDKAGFATNPIHIRHNSSSLTIEYCTGLCLTSSEFTPLTTRNMKVQNLSFKYIPPASTRPAGIETTLETEDATLVFVKYLEK